MFQTTIDLLRHGELLGGVRYRGCTEAELTTAGRSAMDEVWSHLAASVDVIVTSPLGRCRSPAEAWASAAGIDCDVVDDFREMHYGAWEGLSAEEIEHGFPGMLTRWRENPVGMQIPGAESIEDFAGRVVRAWNKAVQAHAGRHVLLVGHSGTLRVIMAHVLGAPLPATRRFSVPYTAWSRVLKTDCGYLFTHLNRAS